MARTTRSLGSMRIIGPPRARYVDVYDGSQPVAQQWFRDEVMPIIWEEAIRLGLDPVGVWAQAIKETGGGAYKGKVSPKAHNTCGLKVKYPGIYGPPTDGEEPAAHAMFPSWEVGARAHVQHVCAYAGLWVINPNTNKPELPNGELIVDPRWWWVAGKYSIEQWSDMNGLWAKPGPTYGTDIEALMTRITS